MATKEQERKALTEIEKIVLGLGVGSYIATAFEGCFEIARDNINNDFACSMKQAKEMAEKDLVETKDILKCREQELADREKEVRELRVSLEHQTDYVNELLDRISKTNEVGMENLAKMVEFQNKCKEQEDEIVRLKAKLYDLITK